MGEALRVNFGLASGSGPQSPRWFWHYQLKKPLFGRFMKEWRWPAGVPEEEWERLTIKSTSHSCLAAVLRRSPQARGVVVCAHPMGLACKGFWLRHGHAQALHDAGYHVLAFDLNGFGESPSTNFDYPADCMAAGQWARSNFPGLRIYSLSASMGAMSTLSAIDMPDFPYDSVIAEGCAPTLLQFWKAYPFAFRILQVSSFFAPEPECRLSPVAHLPWAKAEVPLLLIHSRADRWTPVRFGDEIEAAVAPSTPLRRVILDRADHTHGMRDEPERYLSAVLGFLEAPHERARKRR